MKIKVIVGIIVSITFLGACSSEEKVNTSESSTTSTTIIQTTTTAKPVTTTTAKPVTTTTAKPVTTTTAKPVTTTTAKPVTTTTLVVKFSSCAAAKAAGYSNMSKGSPGYSSNLDRDGDGVACDK